MDKLERTADAACDVLLDFIELGAPVVVMKFDNSFWSIFLGERFTGELHHPLFHT